MTEAHTATPWTWTHHADSENGCHYELHPAEFECGEGDSILYHGANWPMTEADRAFILRAVNSHAALIEAIRSAKTTLAILGVTRLHPTMAELDSALRLAGTGYSRDLHIDGTCEDDTLQSDDGVAPFYVFDAEAQQNIAGPFNTKAEAEAWRAAVLAREG